MYKDFESDEIDQSQPWRITQDSVKYRRIITKGITKDGLS